MIQGFGLMLSFLAADGSENRDFQALFEAFHLDSRPREAVCGQFSSIFIAFLGPNELKSRQEGPFEVQLLSISSF